MEAHNEFITFIDNRDRCLSGRKQSLITSKRKRSIQAGHPEFDELKGRFDELKGRFDEVKAENKKLKNENAELKTRLAFYESPNMPSSVPNLDKENRMRKKAINRKRNAKKLKHSKKKSSSGPRGVVGHKGNTKVLGSPDKIKENNLCSCPYCKSNHFEGTGNERTKTVEDTKVIKKTIVTEFQMKEYKCLDCGKKYYSRHKDCPVKGKIGNNILAQIGVNRLMGRGSLATCALLANTYSKFNTTRQTSNSMINRLVPALEPEYEKIVAKSKDSFVRYADETGHNLNGAKVWIWVSVGEDSVLYMFGDRSRKTARKLLKTSSETPESGHSLTSCRLKILSVDGWKAYNNLGFWIQRCWAHLLRKVKTKNRDNKDAVNFQKAVKDLYMDISEYRDNFPEDNMEKIKAYNQFIDRFNEIIAKFKDIESIEKQFNYFRNGGRDWFTCVLFHEVEMMNNTAELYIRDIVLDRKIFYCFRSEENIKNYVMLKSVIMTWRKNGLNVFDKLIEALENYNAKGIA